MARLPSLDRLALPALFVANLALACGPWLVRLSQTQAHVGPVASAFWRLTLALPVLAVLMMRGRSAPPAGWPMLVGGALLAGLFFAADLAAWHVGILHTRLANATLFGNVTALLFPLYGFLVARRWPRAHQTLALLLATAGATLLLGRSYELAPRNLVGDLFSILAGVCYTAYLIVIARVRGGLGPVATLTFSVAAGAPVLFVAALAFGDAIVPTDWTPLILLTLGSQLIGQGLMMFAIGRASPLVIGLMLLIQPIAASAIGWLIYDERLATLDFVGAAAICAALLLVRDTRKPVQAPA